MQHPCAVLARVPLRAAVTSCASVVSVEPGAVSDGVSWRMAVVFIHFRTNVKLLATMSGSTGLTNVL